MNRTVIVTDDLNTIMQKLPDMATLSMDLVEKPPELWNYPISWLIRSPFIGSQMSRRFNDGQPLLIGDIKNVKMDHSGCGFYWVQAIGNELVWRDVRIV